MLFKKVTGAPITEEDARVLGREFLRIATANRIADLRALSGEIVLNEVLANKRHPLRRFYNWDVDEAARSHWLDRTRVLLNSVRVVEAKVRSTKARKMFVAVKDVWRTNTEGKKENYHGMRIIAEDAAKDSDIFIQCLDGKIQRVEAALKSAEEWLERSKATSRHVQLLDELRSAFDAFAVAGKLKAVG